MGFDFGRRLVNTSVLKLSHCVLTACSYQLMYFLINPKYVNYRDRAIYWLDIIHHLHLHILTKHHPGLVQAPARQNLVSMTLQRMIRKSWRKNVEKLRSLQLFNWYPQVFQDYYRIMFPRVQSLLVNLPGLLEDFMVELTFLKKSKFYNHLHKIIVKRFFQQFLFSLF